MVSPLARCLHHLPVRVGDGERKKEKKEERVEEERRENKNREETSDTMRVNLCARWAFA